MLLHPRRNCNPHQFEGPHQLRSEVSHAGRPPQLSIGPILVQNRVFVVERAEQLRQAKRVFSQPREFQRADDLLDDLVETGCLQHYRPQIVRRIAGSVVGQLVRG